MKQKNPKSKSTTTWLTPPEIIDALGPFDLDPCGFPGWTTAKNHYYLEDNGLALDWFGEVWLNAPYGYQVQVPWQKKLAEHNRGMTMTFVRTDAPWFQWIWDHAEAILFFHKRIGFYRPDFSRVRHGGTWAPSMIASYGSLATERLAKADLKGSLILLANRVYSVVQVPRTWLEVVQDAFLGQPATLKDLYSRLAGHPKAKDNNHYQAKIRQVVQRSAYFRRIKPGLYQVLDQ